MRGRNGTLVSPMSRPESPSAVQTDTLLPPRAVALHSNRDSLATTNSADPSVKVHDSNSYVGLPVAEGNDEKPSSGKKRPLMMAAIGLAAIAVIVVAVVVPVYFKVIKKDNNTTQSASSGSNGSSPTGSNPNGGNPSSSVVTSGASHDLRFHHELILFQAVMALPLPRMTAPHLLIRTSLAASGSLILPTPSTTRLVLRNGPRLFPSPGNMAMIKFAGMSPPYFISFILIIPQCQSRRLACLGTLHFSCPL